MTAPSPAADLVGALVDALAPVADQLPDVRWADATDAERLAVRPGQLAAACPAQAALDGDDGFEPTPVTAGPAASLDVLDRLVHGSLDPSRPLPAADPGGGFLSVWAERLEDWPWDWARKEAGPADRALLAGAVRRRVTALARMLRPWPPPDASTVGHRLRWFHPQRPLRLDSRADLVLGRRDGGHTLVVLLTGDHGHATRRRLAYDALLETVSLRRPPAAVRGLLPDAGRDWAVPVDDALLAEGVAAAADAARLALGVQRRDAAALARRPGTHCRRCAHAGACPQGTAWLDGPGRLAHGFLPP